MHHDQVRYILKHLMRAGEGGGEWIHDLCMRERGHRKLIA